MFLNRVQLGLIGEQSSILNGGIRVLEESIIPRVTLIVCDLLKDLLCILVTRQYIYIALPKYYQEASHTVK